MVVTIGIERVKDGFEGKMSGNIGNSDGDTAGVVGVVEINKSVLTIPTNLFIASGAIVRFGKGKNRFD